MSVLLEELKIASESKQMMWVNLGGVWQRRGLRIKLCFASGDQKSQDSICGRMSINGGCMASAA